MRRADLALRPATDADWDVAWAIQRAAFHDQVTRDFGGWTDEQVTKCRAAWCAAHTRMVLLHDDVVGWARVEHHPGHDWLDLLVITPGRQRAGLGAELLRRLVREAVDRSVPLWLSVHVSNPARRLYARLGFVERPRDACRVFMVFASDGEPGSPPR